MNPISQIVVIIRNSKTHLATAECARNRHVLAEAQ